MDLVRPSDAGDQALLTAFLQLPPTYDNNEDSVVSHLRADLPKSLPRYMVPRVFVFRQLPYNSSRKIDRKALKAETGTRTLEELVNAGSKQHEIVPQTDWTKEEVGVSRRSFQVLLIDDLRSWSYDVSGLRHCTRKRTHFESNQTSSR